MFFATQKSLNHWSYDKLASCFCFPLELLLLWYCLKVFFFFLFACEFVFFSRFLFVLFPVLELDINTVKPNHTEIWRFLSGPHLAPVDAHLNGHWYRHALSSSLSDWLPSFPYLDACGTWSHCVCSSFGSLNKGKIKVYLNQFLFIFKKTREAVIKENSCCVLHQHRTGRILNREHISSKLSRWSIHG